MAGNIYDGVSWQGLVDGVSNWFTQPALATPSEVANKNVKKKDKPKQTLVPPVDIRPPKVPSTPLPTRSVYKVKKGDTLSDIASRADMSLDQLLELNPALKNNPNRIGIGQSINLSSNVGEAAQTTSPKPNRKTKPVSKPEAQVVNPVGAFPTAEDTVALDNPAAGLAGNAPAVAAPTEAKFVRNVSPIERNIGEAGKGFFEVPPVNPLSIPDDQFIAGMPSNPATYNNKVLQRMSDFMTTNPDVSKISRKDAKWLSDLVKQNKVNPDSADDETRRMREQFINWSGISSFE